MFQLIVVIILAFDFVDSNNWRQHNHNYNHHQMHHGRHHEHDYNAERVFHDAAGSLARVDRKLQALCNQHSAQGIRAQLRADGYRLLVPLAGFQQGEVDVQRKHRVVLIRAEHKRDNDTLCFSVVRILPEMVNAAAGVWDLEGEQLKIDFPYKSQDSEWCSEPIEEEKSRIPNVSDKQDPVDVGAVNNTTGASVPDDRSDKNTTAVSK